MACGNDGGGDPTSAAATIEKPSSPEPSPEGITGRKAKNSGEWDLVLTDVRVGEHEGFDRIVLEFTGSGTTHPESEGDGYRGPRRLGLGGGDIDEVYVVGTFEGSTQVLAGIGGDPAQFRVFALTSPTRLVVDVVDDDSD